MTKFSEYPVAGKIAEAFVQQHQECRDECWHGELHGAELEAEEVYQHCLVQAAYGRSRHISRADAYARVMSGESQHEIISSLKIDKP